MEEGDLLDEVLSLSSSLIFFLRFFEFPVCLHDVGGNLKRLAADASLQASSKDPILTADAFYEWTKKNLVKTLVFFSPKEDHAITAQELKSRFASANTVSGTQKYHSFVPSAELTLFNYEGMNLNYIKYFFIRSYFIL